MIHSGMSGMMLASLVGLGVRAVELVGVLVLGLLGRVAWVSRFRGPPR
jgi:hypothetical protein